MANPTCTRAGLFETFPCFDGSVLNIAQRKAILVWFMAKELAALGGTDYTNALTTTLISDTTTLVSKTNPDQRLTAEMTIAYNRAVAAGATVSNDIDVLTGNIACVINYPDLDGMILTLLCKLGVHKTFPQ